jgi:hypothetical protein
MIAHFKITSSSITPIIPYITILIHFMEWTGLEWNEQPIIAEDILLANDAYWDNVLDNASGHWRNPLEQLFKELERFATVNNALRHRDTPEKIIALERQRIVEQWNEGCGQIWEHITTIHRLKGKYATNMAVRAYHESKYQRGRFITRNPFPKDELERAWVNG